MSQTFRGSNTSAYHDDDDDDLSLSLSLKLLSVLSFCHLHFELDPYCCCNVLQLNTLVLSGICKCTLTKGGRIACVTVF